MALNQRRGRAEALKVTTVPKAGAIGGHAFSQEDDDDPESAGHGLKKISLLKCKFVVFYYILLYSRYSYERIIENLLPFLTWLR